MCPRILSLALLFLATGCTGKVATIHFTLEAAPPVDARLASAEGFAAQTPLGKLYCNAAEIRPTWMSTLALAACFDAAGKVAVGGVAPGLSVAGAALQGADIAVGGLQAVAMAYAGKLVKEGLTSAAKNFPTKIETTGHVTTAGTVNVGAIPAVTVNPITGNLQLLAPQGFQGP